MLWIKSTLIFRAFPSGPKAMGSNSILVSVQDLIQALSDNGVKLGSAQRVSSQGGLLDEQSSNIIIIKHHSNY